MLQTFRRAGLIVGINDLSQKVDMEGVDGISGEPISWLTIPTCDRPKELSVALDSYIENAQRFGNKFRCLISDDSRSYLSRRVT
jgi:hypothetical protein